MQNTLKGAFQDEKKKKKRMLISDMKTYKYIQHNGKVNSEISET